MSVATDTIAIAEVSQYLVATNIAKKGFYGGSLAENLATILYCERKALEWKNGLDPNNSTDLPQVAGYVLSLCRYRGKAAYIINNGSGGSVSPITPGSGIDPYEFEVPVTATSNAPIAAGQFSVILSRFIGYNILFVRGTFPQSTINQGGNYYSWDKTTGLFTLLPNPAGVAILGELFQIYPII